MSVGFSVLSKLAKEIGCRCQNSHLPIEEPHIIVILVSYRYVHTQTHSLCFWRLHDDGRLGAVVGYRGVLNAYHDAHRGHLRPLGMCSDSGRHNSGIKWVLSEYYLSIIGVLSGYHRGIIGVFSKYYPLMK